MNSRAERELQEEVLWRANPLPVKITSNLNGLWIPTRESADIECPYCHAVFESPDQKKLVARMMNRLKTDGLLVPGTPDLTIVWRDGGGFIELKRPASRDLFGLRKPAGRASDSQKYYAEDCRVLGINHGYASTWEDVREHLRSWGAIK